MAIVLRHKSNTFGQSNLSGLSAPYIHVKSKREIKKSRRRLLTIVGCFSALLFCVGLYLCADYFYQLAVARNDKSFLMATGDLTVPRDVPIKSRIPIMNESVAWVEAQGYNTWEIVSSDGYKLVGYYIAAKEKTYKTAILAHGYSSNGKDMGQFARYYYNILGYNVFMPDNRGHGLSEGDYIGFGWADRTDYMLWINELIRRLGSDSEFVLHGISMGGATVMMLSGEPLPTQVKAVIEDCGYTSVEDELAYHLKRLYHLPEFPILSATSLLTKARTGFSFKEASALEQVKKSSTPTLFIHGLADTFIPVEMVYQLYNACSAPKELFLVENAGHGMAYQVDIKGYRLKMDQFLAKYMP